MILSLHVVTPLHVGVGQGVGGVELPIARLRPSGFPYVPGSTLKGCLRAGFEDGPATSRLFGSARDATDAAAAGAALFGDAQLVALPVRHARLTFVWLTCPTLLRHARRLGLAFDEPRGPAAADTLDADVRVQTLRPTGDALVAWIAQVTGHAERLVRTRCLVASDEDFAWAAEFATQIDQRNRIDATTGVVVDGALWSEESLPPETVLAAPLDVRARADEDVLAPLRALRVATFGGKNTVGRGVCRVALHAGGEA